MSNVHRNSRTVTALALSVLLAACGQASAQDWDGLLKMGRRGPFRAGVGSVASLDVPEGCLCFNQPDQIAAYLKAARDVDRPGLLGVLFDPDNGFEVWLSYEDVGHVPDDEGGTFDDATTRSVFDAITGATERDNGPRRAGGMPTVTVAQWQSRPSYDTATHRLSWSVLIRGSTGDEVVNHNSRLLGRTGVLSVNLVGPPQVVSRLLPEYERLLAGVRFDNGQTYAQYVPGEKVAGYGLTGLAAGGVAVAAAKGTGLGKLGALLAALVLGGLAKLKGLLFGKKPAAVTAGTGTGDVRQCPSCGQANRLRPGTVGTPACGRCGAAMT